MSVGPAEIRAARERIAGRVRQTFCDASRSLSERLGVPVFLKLEHQQLTGSFKLRGATNAVALLDGEARQRGVVGVSTGNHGRALARAAREAGLRCVICMSALVPPNKLDAIEAEGAEIRIVGRSQDEAQDEVDRLVAEEGMAMVPPFDDPGVIAGQGTLGLEMLEDAPEVETLVIQLSGGGLMAGIAAAAKAVRPGLRVVGVSMERGAAMQASLRPGARWRSRNCRRWPTRSAAASGCRTGSPSPWSATSSMTWCCCRSPRSPRACATATARSGRSSRAPAGRVSQRCCAGGCGRGGRAWRFSRAATSTWTCTAG